MDVETEIQLGSYVSVGLSVWQGIETLRMLCSTGAVCMHHESKGSTDALLCVCLQGLKALMSLCSAGAVLKAGSLQLGEIRERYARRLWIILQRGIVERVPWCKDYRDPLPLFYSCAHTCLSVCRSACRV